MRTLRVDVDFDDLRVFNGKDLVNMFGRGRAGPDGVATYAETEHDGVTIELHAIDSRSGSVSQEVSVPVENLTAVGTDASPVDAGVQKGAQQFRVKVAVSSLEVTGDVGHDPGTE
jgi:hypothetical protein